jgi:NodT family efflux transporter outer membrane factor (OMF) lipoprotein
MRVRFSQSSGRTTAFVAVGAVLAGCAAGPDYKPPSPPSPGAYARLAAAGPAEAGPGEARQRVVVGAAARDWWTAFRQPEIDALVSEALANSPTLAAARARLAQAREAEARARGGFFPKVELAATAARQKTSFLSQGINELGSVTNDYTIGPSVRYAVDVFGGQRRLLEQKRALTQAQAFEYDAASLALSGALVRTAIDAARARDQLAVVDEMVRADAQTVELVERLVGLHRKTVSDLAAARSQLAEDQALAPPLRQQLAVDTDSMAILSGRTPDQLPASTLSLAGLTLPPELPVSVPAELVRRRPDVRAAEAQLQAANAGVGVATAQLYPSLALSGAITQQSLTTSRLFTGAATGGFVSASLMAPLFNAGELRSRRREAVDAYDAAYAQYRQAVLGAVGQVADVLQALDNDAQALAAEQRAVDAAERALQAARAEYAVARADILAVLSAQQALGEARIRQAAARTQRLFDTVQLYVALGGGGVA